MSWGDLRRRRDAIATVIEHARRNPDDEISVEALGVHDVFSTRAELLLALQYDWSHAVWTQVQLMSLYSAGPVDQNAMSDEARRLTAQLRPTLRSLLDRYETELERARVSVGWGRPVQVA
ncbi:MAG TPA: hypothetical protein VJ831_12655 [Jatrophihabitantaceae bacterium]|nr:hypothetical protein [Jatrophihabitantaceae bacterium]